MKRTRKRTRANAPATLEEELRSSFHPRAGRLFRAYARDELPPLPRDKTETLGESKTLGYTRGLMDEAAMACKPAADYFGLPVEVVARKLEEAAAEAARETTSRSATAPPRLKWDSNRLPDENPAAFAWRAYAAEAKAGTLHRGVIYSEDRELHKRLNSWLRSHAMPEGVDIPTLPEWNSRRIEAAKVEGKPLREVATEEARLRKAERYRAAHPM